MSDPRNVAHDKKVTQEKKHQAAATAAGSALHDALRALGTPVHAVADLGGVGHMNSSGLGMLVGAMTNARTGGGDLRLARLAPRTELLLRTTRLLDVFQTFDTADDAVASFQEG